MIIFVFKIAKIDNFVILRYVYNYWLILFFEVL
jgi:hypothetical protein